MVVTVATDRSDTRMPFAKLTVEKSFYGALLKNGSAQHIDEIYCRQRGNLSTGLKGGRKGERKKKKLLKSLFRMESGGKRRRYEN